MTYAEEIDHLARALTSLVARDAPTRSADETRAEIAFASRDIVVEQLTELTRAVVGVQPGAADFPARHVAADPAHALHAALRELPRLSRANGPIALDVLTATGGPELTPWREAVHASVSLESYTEQLHTIPGPQAWRLVRDLGSLAMTVPIIDSDLTERHGRTVIPTGSHGAIRIAVAEMQSRVPTGPNDYDVELDRPVQVVPLQGVSDLPQATAWLAGLISERGYEISAVEIRSAARVLGQGAEVAARALRLAGEANPGLLPTAARLEDAAEALGHLHATPIATLAEPKALIRYLSGEISAQLRVLDGVLDRVEPKADPDERRAALSRVAELALNWAAQGSAATTALTDSIHSSHAAHRLLGRQEHETNPHEHLVWVAAVAPRGADHPRALTHSTAAREALDQVVAPRDDRGNRTIGGTATAASVRAAVALSDLHTAVTNRVLTPAPLAGHPSVRTGARRATDLARKRARNIQGRDRPPPPAP
jgi:hypothetical protein